MIIIRFEFIQSSELENSFVVGREVRISFTSGDDYWDFTHSYLGGLLSYIVCRVTERGDNFHHRLIMTIFMCKANQHSSL